MRRGALFALVLGLAVAGCQKWQTVETSPVTGTAVTQEEDVRVILDDGSRVRLKSPIRADGDSLSGEAVQDRASRRPRESERVRLALADIEEIQKSRSNPGFTFALIVVGVAVVGYIVGLTTIW